MTLSPRVLPNQALNVLKFGVVRRRRGNTTGSGRNNAGRTPLGGWVFRGAGGRPSRRPAGRRLARKTRGIFESRRKTRVGVRRRRRRRRTISIVSAAAPSGRRLSATAPAAPCLRRRRSTPSVDRRRPPSPIRLPAHAQLPFSPRARYRRRRWTRAKGSALSVDAHRISRWTTRNSSGCRVNRIRSRALYFVFLLLLDLCVFRKFYLVFLQVFFRNVYRPFRAVERNAPNWIVFDIFLYFFLFVRFRIVLRRPYIFRRC